MGFYQRLTEKNQAWQTALGDIEQELVAMKREVRSQIETQGLTWMHRNYREYQQRLETRYAQTPDYLGLHQHKPVQMAHELQLQLNKRVANYCNWQQAAMIIHPMMEPFIQDMVSADPLYLVDESHYLLDPTVQQFNPHYQQRLRVYTIEESVNEPILSRLPDQQIGFCLVYNYLNYRPFELVKQYLSEIYQKLLPGAVLAMTFNDCDDYRAIEAVDQGHGGYTPGHLVRAWAKYVGFEEIYSCNDLMPSVWIEFRKPGQFESLRGGQTLARILPEAVANSK